MKKYLITFIFIFSISLLYSCSFNSSQYINPGSKPTINYYTNEIKEKINNNESYKIKIFDLNIYKYYDVNEGEHSILSEFIDSLNEKNYYLTLEEGSSPEYKLILEFSDSKYIINTYNNNFISIFPWDGVYSEDIISMDGVSDYYNLYKFCEYIKKVSNGFEG